MKSTVRRMKMKRITLLFMAFFLAFSLLQAEEPRYTDASFARLTYISGDTYIQRASDLGYEEGMINMPITEGDRLGTTDGRAEIFIPRGKYIRLDQDTKIDFAQLPSRGKDLISLRLWSGYVYLSVQFLEHDKEIEIHTTDLSLYVLDEGLYRIDVRDGMETEVFVFSGMLEAALETGSFLVKASQRLEAVDGHPVSPPTRFAATMDDGFDRWNASREDRIRQRYARRYLPDGLEDYEYELLEYGGWTYLAPYGYVWTPYSQNPSWRPYHYGKWVWLPLCGWTWVSSSPWGWITSHYGRWHWSITLGWYWIPVRAWGPAWVDWYWMDNYWGWVPLGYYGYPVVIINNVFYPRWDRDYIPANSRTITVIHKNQLRARNVSKVSLGQESIQKIGKIGLTSQIPEALSVDGVSFKKIDGSKFIPKQDSSRVIKEKDSSERRAVFDTPVSPPKKLSGGSADDLTEKRNIRKDGKYPSSSAIRPRTSSDKSSRSSDSVLSRVRKYISGSSDRSVRSRSSSSSSRGKSSSVVRSSPRSSSSKSRSAAKSRSSSKSSGKKKR